MQKEINFQSLLDISRHMTLDDFHSRYKNVKIIHKTRNSTVRLAVHIQTGQNVIIKSVYKNSIINSQLKIESILKEVNVLTFLRESKHVTQIYDVVYCLDSFHIVLEYAECGDLFNYINNRSKPLNEAEVKHFFKPIAKTVAMIHRNNIAHRDLKLENVLFDNSGRIMIADFGFATKFNKKNNKSNSGQEESDDDSNLCSSICGTVNYEPPEIVQGDKYDPMKADSWSVGVILYVLMFKYFPFYSPSITDTVQLILSSEVKYPDNMRELFSDELCDILLSLLVKNPKERNYIEDVVNSHPSLFNLHPTPTPASNNTETDEYSYSKNCDDFNIFNTDSLHTLFSNSSTAPIGNVMKQERIHNSALNTITRSKDDFQNLSEDEFISYQIIKRRYQLGQIKYMKARYKSIAPGEFVKIPTSADAAAAAASNKINSNLDLKSILTNGADKSNMTKSSLKSTTTEEYSDDDIDANLINEDEENDAKDNNSAGNTNSNSSDNGGCSDNQINLIEFYAKKSKRSSVGGHNRHRSNMNTQLPAYNPQPNSPSMEVLGQKKPRQLSPTGARRIIKVRSKNNKSPSLSPSSPAFTSQAGSGYTVPSFLISNSAPLSSQLPPPACQIAGGRNDEIIQLADDAPSMPPGSTEDETGEEVAVKGSTSSLLNRKTNRKLSKDLNVLNGDANNLSGLGQRKGKLHKRAATDLKKLPVLNPIDPLSSLPSIQIDLNNGLGGLESQSILNMPNSDDGFVRDKKNDDEKVPSILTSPHQQDSLAAHSRRRNVSRSQLSRKSSNSLSLSSSSSGLNNSNQNLNEDDQNAHKSDFCLESLIAKINEFIDKHDDMQLICEEESGAYVKFGKDENDELLVLLTFTRTGSKSSSYTINRIRGSDENLDKFEKLVVADIGV